MIYIFKGFVLQSSFALAKLNGVSGNSMAFRFDLEKNICCSGGSSEAHKFRYLCDFSFDGS